MTRNGKIAQLPPAIREQLNRRLDDNESGPRLAKWLKSLPEVQALITTEFDNHKITPQNLSEWRKGGLRDWQIHQKALKLALSVNPDDPATQKILSQELVQRLSQWLTIRFAAAAEALASTEPGQDPRAELRLLREFSSDIVALRNGELSAGRLLVEQQRLAMELSNHEVQKEKEHWEWTKRPDIQEKLYPHRDPEKIRREVERLVNRQLLGIDKPAPEFDETNDPAILI